MMPSQTTQMKAQIECSGAGDGLKQAITTLEKKLRNLEKRKTKLDLYRTKANEGQNLDKDQMQAILKYDDVCSGIEFAREFQKQLALINQDCDRLLKKQQKKEKQDRIAEDKKRVRDVLELQEMLNALGGDDVRQDFQSGHHGAVVLTVENLDHLDQLYKLISPTREDDGDYDVNLMRASEHINNVIDARPWPIFNTTYKNLKDLLDLIVKCGYFEHMSEWSVKEDQAAIDVAAESPPDSFTDNVDEQPVAEQIDPCVDPAPPVPTPQVAPSLPDHQSSNATADSFFSTDGYDPVSAAFTPAPAAFTPGVFHVESKRPFHDIMSSVKGSFDFLQESTIEDTDVTHVDPAIVAVHSLSSLPRQPTPVLAAPVDPPLAAPHGQELPANPDSRVRSQSQNVDFSTTYPGYGQTTLVKPGFPEPGVKPAYRGGDDGAAGTGTSHDLTDTCGPPPIPLPHQSHQPSPPEKKFTMNANAAVFTSMYDPNANNPDRDIAASSHMDEPDQDFQTSNSRQNHRAGAMNPGGYRGNRGGGRGGNAGGNRGGSGASGGAYPNKRVYQGYPPRADYKPDAYQGYNNNGFNQGYTKRVHGNRGGGNMTRGSGQQPQRGAPRGSSNRPTNPQ